MAIKLASGQKWHEYVDGVRIQMAPLTTRDLRKIYKEAKGDDETFEELIADHVLLDWEGIVGEDDLKLPVTLASKMAIRDNVALSAWIDSKSKGFTTVKDAELKN
ncbi:MAG TPA: hypothetical protein DDY20_05825 [Desulfobulbaceae bacterium]|jgi:hypothetical protein|nr:hypothetical protein [Desulfobulbaceae bacterium]